MARKIERRPKAAPRARKAGGADNDLAVLFPDREIKAGGIRVTVRELRFAEQIRHNAILAPLADALAVIPPDVLSSDAGVNQILDTLAAHWDGVRALVAVSTGQPGEWVDSLSGADGEALLMTWWAVNQPFFVRRLLRPAIVRNAMRQAGDTSSPSSSAPDTPAATSAATPPGS